MDTKAGLSESEELQGTTSLVQKGEKKSQPAPKRFIRQAVPDKILKDPLLNEAISVLPANYNFEVHKTVWRIQKDGAKSVALQFPEGLLMYSCVLADIFQKFAGAEQVLIMGDVAFGACCVDDLSAEALGAELLVHYGHSCLVPIEVTRVPCMYVFVDIKCDVEHLVATVRHNFEPAARLALAGTIQFASSMQEARNSLSSTHPNIVVPQSKPLSPGEVLGCTAPVLADKGADADAILFVADGRFHLEVGPPPSPP
uniref:2-(3-amino-3-carboxypropyl)histidine synthase subunit 1 n=1 Tax=Tetraselmis sp. GSL018 TaxID=582737 RepID=A0A061R333_9CHLO